ncbi:MAG: thermonuclease family protein [Kofleriaceae bacterium]
MNLVWRAAAVVVVAATAACGSPAPTCGPSSGVVARVIDGDTIDLASGERVRYLLIDTPESTNGATDCYGVNAAQANHDLVLGKTVDLVYDDAQCTDRFGRLLAYVSVDGVEVNSLLVERGYACFLYIPPAGTDRELEFENLELAARTSGRGMWSACAVVTCD